MKRRDVQVVDVSQAVPPSPGGPVRIAGSKIDNLQPVALAGACCPGIGMGMDRGYGLA